MKLSPLFALSLIVTPAAAADVRPNGPYAPTGYCQLTLLGSAALLSTCSGGIPARSTIAEICVEAQGIRYRDDGTSPTASVGMPIASGVCFQYAGLLTALSIIQQTSGAILNVSFYR